MLVIEQGNIYMTKGDDAKIEVQLFDGETEYTMTASDKLTLTVRDEPDGTEVFSVTATGTPTITIPHSATATVAVGKYSADIQLTRGSGSSATITTIWPLPNVDIRGTMKNMKNFILMAQITQGTPS